MKQPTYDAAGRCVWLCDGCGRQSRWTESHEVYGSLKDTDDGKWHLLVVTCSPECKDVTQLAGELRGLDRPIAVAA